MRLQSSPICISNVPMNLWQNVPLTCTAIRHCRSTFSYSLGGAPAKSATLISSHPARMTSFRRRSEMSRSASSPPLPSAPLVWSLTEIFTFLRNVLLPEEEEREERRAGDAQAAYFMQAIWARKDWLAMAMAARPTYLPLQFVSLML